MLPGLLRYIRRARAVINEFDPDLLWACSDSLYGIVGSRLARKSRKRWAFDIYDNFEYFGMVSVPSVRARYRRAVREADGVTCVSQALAGLLKETCAMPSAPLVVENGVRKDLFHPRDKQACRERMGLPADKAIIGVAGALSSTRGIETVFEGFEALAARREDLHLVVAGPRDGGLRIPEGTNVHDLGMLPLDKVPELLCALDIAVISNKDSAFGRYCFPQKLNEIMACEVPFVAADVGAMQSVLASHTEFLFKPEDPADFARAIERQLDERFLLDRPVPSWDDQAGLVEDLFRQLLTS